MKLQNRLMGSQEVTSERCAETLLCFVCVNLCAKKGKLLTKGFRFSTKHIRLLKKKTLSKVLGSVTFI